jgi:Putative DNA-binding domain
MPSLHELQSQVMDALLRATPEGAAALVDSPDGTAVARLQIYQNNVRANFVAALRSSYPAIWRLVGGDYFRQIARQYHASHPSRSGDLLHVGEFFADHLAELHQDDGFSYLVDVARLERQIEEALLAAEHAPLDLTKLATVAPTAYDALRFELHPALRLFESRFPALRIWEANVQSDAEPEPLDLDAGGDLLAVMRQGLQLKFHRLSRGEHAFLDALRRGRAFATAVQAGDEHDPSFDAAASLPRFVAATAIVGFQSAS